jgi:hypothetical protein
MIYFGKKIKKINWSRKKQRKEYLNLKIDATTRYFQYIPGRNIIRKFVFYYLSAILIEKYSWILTK